ncbi:Kinesin-like protein kif27 [Coelomomyces lativittatus]|nr:Kinesin-like protein kif27 [Coelomomyces lativittatus]
MTSTSVKVALRVRPLTAKETLSNCSECISFIQNEPQIVLGTDRCFTFDYVFEPNAFQASVYSTCVASLIQKFIEGYNATVLAYGQVCWSVFQF